MRFACILMWFVLGSGAVFAQSEASKTNFSHVDNSPIHFQTDNEEVDAFITATLTIIAQLAPDGVRGPQSKSVLTFVATPDAILNDHMNTDYLGFLNSNQRASVSKEGTNGLSCYVQEYTFNSGQPWIAAASNEIDPEFSKMCFLLAVRFWMGAKPEDMKTQPVGLGLIEVLNEIVNHDGGSEK
jgi:hypothetical protein